jgi:dolichol-phosphate mannosyltransferase
MRNNIVIIIPSYNAKNTVIKAIEGIFLILPEAKIFVVDDSSPDGTGNLINQHLATEKRLRLIVRKEKSGRGSAVLRGLKEALKDKHIQYFVEMDADLCHDPKYIPLLIEKCQKADVAIASKYLKGSKIIGLEKKRVIFSKLVNLYLKLMLRIPITDYTNGFRCYTRKALEQINLDSFYSKGFIVLSEIAYRIKQKGGTFAEIPFVFIFNKTNKSNFSLKEIREAFFTVLKLKFNPKPLQTWVMGK